MNFLSTNISIDFFDPVIFYAGQLGLLCTMLYGANLAGYISWDPASVIGSTIFESLKYCYDTSVYPIASWVGNLKAENVFVTAALSLVTMHICDIPTFDWFDDLEDYWEGLDEYMEIFTDYGYASRYRIRQVDMEGTFNYNYALELKHRIGTLYNASWDRYYIPLRRIAPHWKPNFEWAFHQCLDIDYQYWEIDLIRAAIMDALHNGAVGGDIIKLSVNTEPFDWWFYIDIVELDSGLGEGGLWSVMPYGGNIEWSGFWRTGDYPTWIACQVNFLFDRQNPDIYHYIDGNLLHKFVNYFVEK